MGLVVVHIGAGVLAPEEADVVAKGLVKGAHIVVVVEIEVGIDIVVAERRFAGVEVEAEVLPESIAMLTAGLQVLWD